MYFSNFIIKKAFKIKGFLNWCNFFTPLSFVRLVSSFVSLIKSQSNDFKKCHFLQSKVGNLVSFNLLHQHTQQTPALYIKQIYKLITKLQIYTHKKSFFLFPLARKSKPPYSATSSTHFISLVALCLTLPLFTSLCSTPPSPDPRTKRYLSRWMLHL